jgi:hypothetical protein
VRLAHESTRGGLLIDHLVCIAVESMGTSGLQKLSGQLDAGACREAAKTLEGLDAHRQTWTEVMQQEQGWSRRTFTGVGYALARVLTKNSQGKALASGKQKFETQQRRTRQLITDLAVRAYTLDNGHPPSTLAELVPAYLTTAPLDPVSGKPLAFSAN